MYHHRPLLIWNKGGPDVFAYCGQGPSIPTSLKDSGARAPVVRPQNRHRGRDFKQKPQPAMRSWPQK